MAGGWIAEGLGGHKNFGFSSECDGNPLQALRREMSRFIHFFQLLMNFTQYSFKQIIE